MKLAGLEPSVRAAAEWCVAVAEYYGVPVTVTSGFRSVEHQARLYRNYQRCVAAGEFGKTARCMFPAAPPGSSSHNYGLAWDSTTEPWAQSWWNYVRELAGFQVLPNDIIHAQVPNWQEYVR